MDLTDKEIESLQIVAESDCSASWIAERILESKGYSSYSSAKPQEPHAMPESEPDTEPERSLFAL